MQTVLVTGASSGIGRETARRLAAGGYRVFATARRGTSVAELESEGRERGFEALELDVNDETSVTRAMTEVQRRSGGVDVLVNNAGYGLLAPVETVTVEALRQQFETNVFGAHRMVRAVLPGMRARRRGTIVQISSVAGRVVFPMYGAYSASKFALEALSDALRMEVAPYGIRVVLIEPGPIHTAFSDASARESSDANADERGGAYASIVAGVQAMRSRSRGSSGVGPEVVAEVIARAVAAKRPDSRYTITSVARVMPMLRTALPVRVLDRVMRAVVERRK